jgi:glycosyltransferase involved in cell wall biosynthesis
MLVENLPVPFDRRMWQEALALREAEYQVSVICPKGGPWQKSYENLEGVHIYRYPPPRETQTKLSYVWEFTYCWAASALLSLVVFARHGFDIIHAANPPDTFFLLARLYKFLGKKFVYDQHDLCPEVFLSRFGTRGGLIPRLLVLLEKLSYRAADVVLSTNLSYRQVALTRGGVPADRVFVVRSGPDTERFRPRPPDPSIRNGHQHLVCYLGVMAPQDGVDYLLRSIRYIVHERKRNDVRFVLIGSGDCFNQLRAMADDMQLNGSVHFTGRISDDDLQRYLSSADVCVAPDPKNELNDVSTMNKVLEYMAMARPIVAYDLKETRFSAGDGAVYATPNDEADFARKVLDLLDDPERSRAMGLRNRQRLEATLAWEYNKRELLRAYETLARRVA